MDSDDIVMGFEFTQTNSILIMRLEGHTAKDVYFLLSDIHSGSILQTSREISGCVGIKASKGQFLFHLLHFMILFIIKMHGIFSSLEQELRSNREYHCIDWKHKRVGNKFLFHFWELYGNGILWSWTLFTIRQVIIWKNTLHIFIIQMHLMIDTFLCKVYDFVELG